MDPLTDGMSCIITRREQFIISQATPEYEQLLSLLPGEYVGTSMRLKPLVKLLCLEMEQAFQERGLTWPPWRQADSMMSKWLPSKVINSHLRPLLPSAHGLSLLLYQRGITICPAFTPNFQRGISICPAVTPNFLFSTEPRDFAQSRMTSGMCSLAQSHSHSW